MAKLLMYVSRVASMTIYNDIMELLKHRMVGNYERLAPLYICGIGCHIFNIVNKKIKVFSEGAIVADSRLHVIMVTVPGFGKSFMLKQFLSDGVGIISGTKLKPRFCGSMTTASFIGSMKSNSEGEPVINKGLADKYSTSVLGIHEFAEITNSMQQTYNVGLNDALLSALDDGKINKDVVSGEIKYETMVTLFSAVQPARYNLTSGLGRRLLFIVYVPTMNDFRELRKIRRRSRNVVDNKELLRKIKGNIDELYNKVETITSVRFSNEFYEWMDRNNIVPYEEILYERIGIGYWIMNEKIKSGGELYVDIDDKLVEIFNHQKRDRTSVKNGVNDDQVWRVIKDEKIVKKEELITLLLEFSLNRNHIESSLRTLQVLKKIKVEGEYVKVVGQ